MKTRWRMAFLVSAAIATSYLDQQTLPVAIGAVRRTSSPSCCFS